MSTVAEMIQSEGMNIDFGTIIIAIPVLALSIAFHEMMHAFVSDALGDDTARRQGRVTLNPFSHIDPITTVALPLILLLIGLPPFGAARPVPFNPARVKFEEFGVALVALAGPLTNLLLAIVAGLIYRYGINAPGLLEHVVTVALQINVGFFIFNLIPFPPLDGSRVLYAFAPEPLQRVMMQIEQLGFMGLIIFMVLLFPIIQGPLIHISDSLLTRLT